MEELEAYVYNYCFVLYSILYDGSIMILELRERGKGYFEKYLKKFFGNLTLGKGNEIYITATIWFYYSKLSIQVKKYSRTVLSTYLWQKAVYFPIKDCNQNL